MCFGSSKKEKSVTTVQTAPPSKEESDAQRMATSGQMIEMERAGYVPNYDVNGNFFKWDRRDPTDEERQTQARDQELEDMVYRKLKGELTPEEESLLDQSYDAAISGATSDLNAAFSRSTEELGIGENRAFQDIQRELQRGTQDINQAAITGAGERGLQMSDTPIMGERMKAFQRFGEDVGSATGRTQEDVNRNKRMLGEDYLRNTADMQTSLRGAKAGARLDVMGRGQVFAQALQGFQAQLQQQAFINKQAISGSFQNTANALGSLRGRNYTQTGSGASSSPTTMNQVGGAMQGAGGMMQGISSLWSSFGSMSSRDFKDNIEPVDSDQILNELDATPIYTWTYKPQFFNDYRQHIGPVVEESPDRITEGKMLVSTDMLGFLFAAVKALSDKVKRLEGLESRKTQGV